MGQMIREYEEQVARGFFDIENKFVCPHCFDDLGIQQFIANHATEKACSYCKRTFPNALASSMNQVMQCIVAGLRTIYADPCEDGVPWASLEGGWLGQQVFDTDDLVMKEIGLAEGNDELLQDIVNSLGNREWCQINHALLLPEDELNFGWKEFCRAVKHKTRFIFLNARKKHPFVADQDRDLPLENMLAMLGNFSRRLNLITIVPRGEMIFRCRVHEKGKTPNSVKKLGPPSEKKAKYSNRMSPAGIPMFYGGFDDETCLLETFNPKKDAGKHATTAAFKPRRRLVMLDLTVIPSVPSLFDAENRNSRPSLIFLHKFAADISKPIVKNRREHIEYVPSQIVTEYFRQVFRPRKYRRIDGIIYQSAKNPPGKACVIFCRSEDCADRTDKEKAKRALLTLSASDVTTFDPYNRKSVVP